MKNLLFSIVLFAFGGFVNAQNVTHNINNITNSGGLCSSYNLFASFNDSGNCPPSFAGVNCFDVPLGVTSHDALNESCSTFTDIVELRGMTIKEQISQSNYYVSFCDINGNLQLTGGGNINLPSCSSPTTAVIWSIDVPNNTINVTIL